MFRWGTVTVYNSHWERFLAGWHVFQAVRIAGEAVSGHAGSMKQLSHQKWAQMDIFRAVFSAGFAGGRTRRAAGGGRAVHHSDFHAWVALLLVTKWAAELLFWGHTPQTCPLGW